MSEINKEYLKVLLAVAAGVAGAATFQILVRTII